LLIAFAIMSYGITGWTLDIIMRLAGLYSTAIRYFRVVYCDIWLFCDDLFDYVFACEVYAEPIV